MATLSITKSYDDGAVLTEADLDNIKNDVETFLNTTKINDDNIQNAGITASSKLVDGSVSAAKIATSAVSTAKIADEAVTTNKLADESVTAAKLATTAINTVLPAGAILPYGGTSAPTGYLICDGSAVSRTTYATLFTAIGENFGQGDNSTTFNVPDLRGRFLRGTDNMGSGAASRDPDAASRTAMNTGGNSGNNVGSVQDDATAKNSLALTDPGHDHLLGKNVNSATAPSASNYLAVTRTGSGGAIDYDLRASTSVPDVYLSSSETTGITLGNGDNETRPLNAYVNYIIKT